MGSDVSKETVSELGYTVGHSTGVTELLDVWKTHTRGISVVAEQWEWGRDPKGVSFPLPRVWKTALKGQRVDILDFAGLEVFVEAIYPWHCNEKAATDDVKTKRYGYVMIKMNQMWARISLWVTAWSPLLLAAVRLWPLSWNQVSLLSLQVEGNSYLGPPEESQNFKTSILILTLFCENHSFVITPKTTVLAFCCPDFRSGWTLPWKKQFEHHRFAHLSSPREEFLSNPKTSKKQWNWSHYFCFADPVNLDGVLKHGSRSAYFCFFPYSHSVRGRLMGRKRTTE